MLLPGQNANTWLQATLDHSGRGSGENNRKIVWGLNMCVPRKIIRHKTKGLHLQG